MQTIAKDLASLFLWTLVPAQQPKNAAELVFLQHARALALVSWHSL